MTDPIQKLIDEAEGTTTMTDRKHHILGTDTERHWSDASTVPMAGGTPDTFEAGDPAKPPPIDSTAPAGAALDERRLARLRALAAAAAPDTDDLDWGDPETWRGLGDTSNLDLAVASYIAATRPSVLLALLADRDCLAARVEILTNREGEWRGELHAAAVDARKLRDRLATMSSDVEAKLSKAYDEGWNEGCGSAGADS